MFNKQQRLEDAKKYVLTFGKYKGETLYTVVIKDYDYCSRLLNSSKKENEEAKKNLLTIMYGSLLGK